MNVLNTPPLRSGSALEYSLTGINRSREQFYQSAVEVIDGFAAQANKMSAGGGETALSSASFVSAVATDPSVGIVDMIQAQRAFEANLKTFQAADEMEQSALDILA